MPPVLSPSPQTWGLLELQRGNRLAAYFMLLRSASTEPRNRPVLRWAPVRAAVRQAAERRRARTAAMHGSSGDGK